MLHHNPSPEKAARVRAVQFFCRSVPRLIQSETNMKKLFFASFVIVLCAFVQNSFAIPPNYVVTTTSGASIVPGTTDIGNHCDDCVTSGVSIPFAFTFYDHTFTSVNISSNGNLQFSSSNNDTSSCVVFDGINVIAPGWTD